MLTNRILSFTNDHTWVDPAGAIPLWRAAQSRDVVAMRLLMAPWRGNFASDENPKKETARHMIQMVQEINGKFPDGKMLVTCYTCHRGKTQPKTAPEPKPAAGG